MRFFAVLAVCVIGCSAGRSDNGSIDGPAAVPNAPAIAAPIPPPAPAPAALSARRFLLVEGQVSLDGQPAAVGMPIGETAKIETAAGARALISVQVGSVIEVREKSRLDIGASARRKTSVQLLTGILWNILPTGQADYEVVTANAVAGVRGTSFFVNATDPKTSYVCVCDGEVDLAAGGKPGQHVVSHAEHAGYAASGAGKKAKLKLIGKAQDVPSHPNAQREVLRAMAPQ